MAASSKIPTQKVFPSEVDDAESSIVSTSSTEKISSSHCYYIHSFKRLENSDVSSSDFFDSISEETERPHRLSLNYLHKQISSLSLPQNPNTPATPRKVYENLWEKASGNVKKGIVILLDDYTKGKRLTSNIALFAHGHFGRPFVHKVRNLLKCAFNLNEQEMINELFIILNASKKKSCSLQRRLDFILSKAPQLKPEEDSMEIENKSETSESRL